MARPRKEPTAAQRALGLLVRREHSRPELARKLRARGVPAEEARAAVAQMAESGWQDDARFACSLARSRVAGGYGPLRIRVELESHGLDAAAIGAAFEALAETGDDDWEARARELVRRRFGADLAAPPVRRKAQEFLLRRGFEGDCVRLVIP
ncbi:MAG TPA: regulatory protein RecX [Luteimonas sp.]|jgi:regulatory protein